MNVREDATGELMSVDGIPSPAARVVIRDISATPPAGDLLIAGTKPDVLREFEAAPATTLIRDAAGIESGAGQKLGHAFFKLKDTNPASASLIRNLTGLGTSVRLHRRYLTPLLTGPKELVSGESNAPEHWLLTLPRELPTNAAIRDYIRYGRAEEVHVAPSVESRGDAWWSLTPALWDIAVPMSAQFKHQVAYLNPAGAVTNNFHGLKFENPRDGLIVGASLASAFGALARLYVSGEIGCEGLRRVALIQFQEWPILDPSRVRGTRHEARCLQTYERWRVFDSSEIDEMAPDELAAWRDLTEAVAIAAFGTSASAARSMADSAITEAQSTVARRRTREAAALGGRTRQAGGARTSASARLRQWLSGSSEFRRVVELLTSGPTQYSLRNEGELQNLALFENDHPLGAVPYIELELIRVLGAGFDAAWPDPSDREALETIIVIGRELLDTAITVIAGEPPPVNSPASAAWREIAAAALDGLRKAIQVEVRKTLL
ncbi:MAG: hypothetical protein Q7S20_13010 [Gemmatimonadaceae bacterium]|nr:hypothetical protein [Gemmatimonadaceae bacterium]